MKCLNRLLVWMLVLGALAAGIILLYIAILGAPPADLQPYVAMRAWRLVAGLLAVILAVLTAATSFTARARDERFISFESDAGTVSVSVDAVTEFLVKTSREFAGILGMDAKIPSREEPIEILLDVKIKSGSNIPELSRLLQQHIRLNMRETIGISDISAIRVKVREIVADNAPSSNRESNHADWHNA